MTPTYCYIIKAVFVDTERNCVVSRAYYSGKVPSESFLSIDIQYYRLRFRQYLHTLLPRRVVVYVRLRKRISAQ